MDEQGQLDLFNNNAECIGRPQESEFYHFFRPLAESVMDLSCLPFDLLRFNACKGYSSLTFRDGVVFRIVLSGKKPHVSIPRSECDLSFLTGKEVEDTGNSIKIYLNNSEDACAIAPFLAKVLDRSVDDYPHEYDCCSRYLEYSDHRKCQHPDKHFAAGCGYRVILKHGHVFYGENRNAD